MFAHNSLVRAAVAAALLVCSLGSPDAVAQELEAEPTTASEQQALLGSGEDVADFVSEPEVDDSAPPTRRTCCVGASCFDVGSFAECQERTLSARAATAPHAPTEALLSEGAAVVSDKMNIDRLGYLPATTFVVVECALAVDVLPESALRGWQLCRVAAAELVITTDGITLGGSGALRDVLIREVIMSDTFSVSAETGDVLTGYVAEAIGDMQLLAGVEHWAQRGGE